MNNFKTYEEFQKTIKKLEDLDSFYSYKILSQNESSDESYGYVQYIKTIEKINPITVNLTLYWKKDELWDNEINYDISCSAFIEYLGIKQYILIEKCVYNINNFWKPPYNNNKIASKHKDIDELINYIDNYLENLQNTYMFMKVQERDYY